MLPQYQRLDSVKPIVRLPFGWLAILCLSLPLGAFIFCIVWSVLFEFERSTFTHCDVLNLLPSISAAIGSFDPQRSIWQLAIVLHMPFRFLCIRLYFIYFCDTIRRSRRQLAKLACVLNAIENVSLLCLSLWTSTDDYEIHRNAFITFIACSELYMLMSYVLFTKERVMPLLAIEEKSLWHKRYLFLINISAFCLAGYCFQRHNNKCEPMIYTYFALFEYIVVLSNMGYHMTAYWDFHNIKLNFDWNSGISISKH